jgi:inner membrane protein
MLAFAHIGIAVGCGVITDTLGSLIASKKEPPVKARVNQVNKKSHSNITNQPSTGRNKIRVDYRFLIIGSMLPDIIDKPLGQVILKDVFSNGRIFSHTLLFLLSMFIIGILVYKFAHKSWFLNIAFGVLIHQALDGIWLYPTTFLWPVWGMFFPRYNLTNWAQSLIESLTTNPWTYVPEGIGAVILVYYFVILLVKKSFLKFFKTGYMPNTVLFKSE